MKKRLTTSTVLLLYNFHGNDLTFEGISGFDFEDLMCSLDSLICSGLLAHKDNKSLYITDKGLGYIDDLLDIEFPIKGIK